MESGAKVQGHSVHSILVVLPLGLLSTGVIFDFVRLLGGSEVFTTIAYWMTVAGLVSGVAAAIVGWADWAAIPEGSRAKRLGLIHGIVNMIVLALYAASLSARSADPSQPQIAAAVLSTVGAGFALIGGWLGGELAERLAVGDHAGENYDAPGTLSITRVHGTPSIARR